MKIGFRTPSLSRSIKARTSGRINRKMKSALNPLYGKKGMGLLTDPEKAVYNKIYNKTSRPVFDERHFLKNSASPKQTNPAQRRQGTFPPPFVICPRCGLRYDRRRPACPRCGLSHPSTRQSAPKKTMASWKKISLSLASFFLIILIFGALLSHPAKESLLKKSPKTEESVVSKPVSTVVKTSKKAEQMSATKAAKQTTASINQRKSKRSESEKYVDVVSTIKTQAPILAPPAEKVSAVQSEEAYALALPEKPEQEATNYQAAPVQSDIVFATASGKKYHRAGCQHVSGKDNLKSMTKAEAIALNLQPCKDCRP